MVAVRSTDGDAQHRTLTETLCTKGRHTTGTWTEGDGKGGVRRRPIGREETWKGRTQQGQGVGVGHRQGEVERGSRGECKRTRGRDGRQGGGGREIDRTEKDGRGSPGKGQRKGWG